MLYYKSLSHVFSLATGIIAVTPTNFTLSLSPCHGTGAEVWVCMQVYEGL